MKYVDEFRDKKTAEKLINEISRLHKEINRTLTFMEVCGTHTVAISRYGLRKLMPQGLRLISGPGCPVCVTPDYMIDKAIAYASLPDTILVTFGDMLRVPGSDSTLEKEKAKGCDVRMVYSTTDAIKIAEENPSSNVLFFGIGFETTSPTVAASLLEAYNLGISNYFVLCAHKIIPPAMEALISNPELKIDGFICPGHVSTIIGSKPYEFIPLKFGISCVIAGFEPVDILETIYRLLCQIRESRPIVEIQYRRVVTEDGNKKAKEMLEKVFETVDSEWRGLGIIQDSGLKIRTEFSKHDAETHFKVKVDKREVRTGCMCGDVLRGIKLPPECLLFKNSCTPEHPVGACMVSSEGTCSSYYKYEG